MSIFTTDPSSRVNSRVLADTGSSRFTEILKAVQMEPLDMEAIIALKQQCVDALVKVPLRQKSGKDVEDLAQLVDCFMDKGLLDAPVGQEVLDTIAARKNLGWCWLPVALLSAPAWQVSALPRIEEVPYAFWPALVKALFRKSGPITDPSLWDAYCEHYVKRLIELVRLSESNAGSAAVRAALARYSTLDDCQFLTGSNVELEEVVQLRARLLAQIHRRQKTEEPIVSLRDGRRLKIAHIVPSADASPVLRDALAQAESLDANRFEVGIYHLGEADLALGEHLAACGVACHVLPAEIDSALDMLTMACIDIAIFHTDALRTNDRVTVLALARIAPLQIVADLNKVPFPLPSADLHLTDIADYRLKEGKGRLGYLPWSGMPLIDKGRLGAVTREWSKSGMGIGSDEIVCACLAPFSHLSAGLLSLWSEILERCPKTSLLIYSYTPEDTTDTALGEMSILVGKVFAGRSIDPARVIVSNERFASLADVMSLMKIVDLYLDTGLKGGDEGVRIALDLGIPVISLRTPLGMIDDKRGQLEKIGLGNWIASDRIAYVSSAVAQCAQPESLHGARGDLAAALAKEDTVFDPAAFGEVLGAVYEKAFDEITLSGSDAFRKISKPVCSELEDTGESVLSGCELLFESGAVDEAALRIGQVLSVFPRLAAARDLNRRLLFARQQWHRASESLLAAVERQGANASLWLSLSKAFSGAGRRNDALAALDTGLRLDPSNVDGWLSFAELARDSGNDDLLRHVIEVLVGLAGDDPRVAELRLLHGLPKKETS